MGALRGCLAMLRICTLSAPSVNSLTLRSFTPPNHGIKIFLRVSVADLVVDDLISHARIGTIREQFYAKEF